jgi:hypothetical protein
VNSDEGGFLISYRFGRRGNEPDSTINLVGPRAASIASTEFLQCRLKDGSTCERRRRRSHALHTAFQSISELWRRVGIPRTAFLGRASGFRYCFTASEVDDVEIQ